MFVHSGYELAEPPKVFPTKDSILIFRRNSGNVQSFVTNHLQGDDYIQVAAVMQDRYATWTFYVVQKGRFDLSLKIDQERGWRAFVEVPELFRGLADIDLKRTNLEDVVHFLIKFGAVEQIGG